MYIYYLEQYVGKFSSQLKEFRNKIAQIAMVLIGIFACDFVNLHQLNISLQSRVMLRVKGHENRD